MKICCKCKTEKTLDGFHSNKRSKDGLNYQCRTCCADDKKIWKSKNKVKMKGYRDKWNKKNKQYYRDYNASHTISKRFAVFNEDGDKYCFQCRVYKPVGSFTKAKTKTCGYNSYCKVCQKVSRGRIQHQIIAHRLLNSAIRTGKVVRGNCSVCGEAKTHGHHEDYSKPLEVIWLCGSHHLLLHNKKD